MLQNGSQGGGGGGGGKCKEGPLQLLRRVIMLVFTQCRKGSFIYGTIHMRRPPILGNHILRVYCLSTNSSYCSTHLLLLCGRHIWTGLNSRTQQKCR